jgi:hypothetical protein
MLRCLEPPKPARPVDPELIARLARRTGRPRIRCPRCLWEHDGKKHWACEDCGEIFDTFVTGAACPSCPNSWKLTQCPKCDALSPHDDWYERESPSSEK